MAGGVRVTAFYNENNPHAANWLRNLISAGHIAPGAVDERSIVDIEPSELAGYAQCHFFAGIGGWSFALRLAGWPDDRPVWTGSCPCQPFSAAGKGEGHEDERHLWPTWFRLIRERRPATVYGEQVAGEPGLGWLDLVSTDLENDHYAVAAADLCAASIGADHIRRRLFWTASDTTRVDGNSHDRLVESGARRASVAARRLAGVRVAGCGWNTEEGTAHRPLLLRNHHGLSHILAGLGNAIVPQVAAAFIEACQP